MRSFKLLFVVGLLTFILSGCTKEYISSVLTISNETGEDLWVESNIVSTEYSDPKNFEMSKDIPYRHEVLARSVNYENGSVDLPLSSCVYNEEASVSIYREGDTGEKILVQQWRYAERHEDGRNLFNESNLERQTYSNVAGHTIVSFHFTILPEDIGE